MSEVALSPARPGHGPALNRLILRSKAYWGYDAEMMNIMARVLRLDPDAMATGRAMAGWRGGEPLGVAQISQPHEDERGRSMALDLLFIAPDAIGTGLGRILYDWAVTQARAAGCTRLDILSDPNAEAFYLAMGARKVADRQSQAVPGRTLPFLEHQLV
ncbi:MAG: GNAT family N-acetyltransferase [Oceanicaulis sp.]